MEYQVRRLGRNTRITVLSPSNENHHVWTVGRGSQCDIFTKSKYASRKHFSVICKSKKFYLLDHGSSNGTYLNDEKITAFQEYPLNIGNIISVGVPSICQNQPDCIVFIFEGSQEKVKCSTLHSVDHKATHCDLQSEVQKSNDFMESNVEQNNLNKAENISDAFIKKEPDSFNIIQPILGTMKSEKNDPGYNLELQNMNVCEKVTTNCINEKSTTVNTVVNSGLKIKTENKVTQNSSITRNDQTSLKSVKIEDVSFENNYLMPVENREVDLFSAEDVIEEDMNAYEVATQADASEPEKNRLSYTMTEELIEISDSEDDWPGVSEIKSEPDNSILHDASREGGDEYDSDVIFTECVIKSKEKKKFKLPEIKIECEEDLTETDRKWRVKLFKTEKDCEAFIQSQREDSQAENKDDDEHDDNWVQLVKRCSEEIDQVLLSEGVTNEAETKVTDDDNWVQLVKRCSEEIDQVLSAEGLTNKAEIKVDDTVSEQFYVQKEDAIRSNFANQKIEEIPETVEPVKSGWINDKEERHERKRSAEDFGGCSTTSEKPSKMLKLYDPLKDDLDEDNFLSQSKTKSRLMCSIPKKKIQSLQFNGNQIKVISPICNNTNQSKLAHMPGGSKRRKKKRRKKKLAIAPYEKELIRNHRKQKLRLISMREAEASHESQKKPNLKIVAPLKVKITHKNRGEYLCQEMAYAENHIVGEGRAMDECRGIEDYTPQHVARCDVTNSKKHVSPEFSFMSQSCNSSNGEQNAKVFSEETATNIDVVDHGGEVKVIVNTEDRASLKSCLKKIGFAFMKANRPIVPKKMVRFDAVKDIRYYEVENAFMRKTSRHKHFPQLPSSEDCSMGFKNVLHNIFGWNTLWLEECKSAPKDEFPPPFQPGKLKPIQKKFLNHEEYVKSFIPLLLLDLWHSVSEKWKNSSNSMYRFPATCTSFEVITEGPNGNLAVVSCESVVPCLQGALGVITEGSLVIIQLSQIPLNDEGHILSQESKKKLVYRIFGYLSEKSLEFARGKEAYRHFPETTSINGNVQKMKLELIVKSHLRFNIEEGSTIHITLVDLITPCLRQCQAVSYLQKSPLCKVILTPNRPDMTLSGPLKQENIIFNGPLDDLQRELILRMTSTCINRDRILLEIQGGPGTGKSHITLAFILQVLYTRHWREPLRPKILYCSHSNEIVDEFTLKLKNYRQTLRQNTRYKLVRYGNLSSMKPAVRDISSHHLALQNEYNLTVARKVQALDDQIKLVMADLEISNKLTQSDFESKSAELHKLTKERDTLKNWKLNCKNGQKPSLEAESLIIENADVICTTCFASGTTKMNSVFDKIKAKSANQKIICIVDQAMHSKEPETIIPLQLGVTHLILVGDSRQLRPPARSEKAQSLGLNQSLFWRLLHSFDKMKNTMSPVFHLKNQYRMNPSILLFPNKIFYQNTIKNGRSRSRICNIEEYLLLLDNGLPTPTAEESELRLQKIARNLVTELLKIVSRERANFSICVITCRLDQAKLMRTTLGESQSRVEINSIENIHGQEFDIVVFLFDAKMHCAFRANVAMTRAKYSLFILTTDSLYKDNKLLNKLVKDASDRYVFSYVNANMGSWAIHSIITKSFS